MRQFSLISGLYLSLACASAASAQSSIGFAEAPDPLVEAKWKNRLLVVCEQGDGIEDPPLVSAQYEEAFTDWPGYIERDLILVWLTPSDAMSWKPVPNPDPNKAATLMMRFHPDDKTGLVDRTSCRADSQQVSLIGLDGGVKAAWETTVTNEELYQLIDAMPMRQQELRGRPRQAGD